MDLSRHGRAPVAGYLGPVKQLSAILVLALATAPPAKARRRNIPQLRVGGNIQDQWVIGTMRDTTVDFLLEKRHVRWRESTPYDRVQETLHVLRHHKDWRTREAAIDDLLWNPSAKTEEALIRALRDPIPRVRETAALALAKVGTNRSLVPLMNAMKSTPGPARDTLGETLRTLTGEDYGRHLDRWTRWWRANRDALR